MYSPSSVGALRQCEILSDITQIQLMLDQADPYENPTIQFPTHPYAIVLTQDCDLEWDFKERNEQSPTGGQGSPKVKIIHNVLLCEVSDADRARAVNKLNADLWRYIKRNMNERYHYLSGVAPEYDLCNEQIPDLLIDFKKCFTIPTAELYWGINAKRIRRRCRLNSPYLHDLTFRFYYFQCRVALP